ncbi:DUF2461 domain-containing protein [Bacteroidota bacterium]
MNDILSYIEDLKRNNNREWFHENKDRYDKVRGTFTSLISEIIAKLQFADPRLAGLEAKDTIFRIYRDIRFSKDKTPYKTHFSAYIARGGRKSKEAGYYVHVSKEELFIGAGVYQPEKEDLKAIRQEILYQPEQFKSLVKSLEKSGFHLMEDDKLKIGPKDYPKDSPYIEYLKFKHFIAMKEFNLSDIKKGNYTEVVMHQFSKAATFTEFLNSAMEFKGNE